MTQPVVNTDTDLIKHIQNQVSAGLAIKDKYLKLNNNRPTDPAPTPNFAFSLVDSDRAATHVFIDDRRNPGDVNTFGLPDGQTWRVLRSYREFEQYLDKHGIPEFVSFDFNLEHEKTGHDCAQLLVKRCLENNLDKLPGYLYHGDLESGRIIESYLMFYGKHKRIYKAKHETGQPAVIPAKKQRSRKKR